MSRHRLHVETLESIGAVDAGDNPEADIMFWKRAPVEKQNLTADVDAVHQAWAKIHPTSRGFDPSWVRAVHDTFALVEEGDITYRVPWSRNPDDGSIHFGARERVEVTESITPVEKTIEPEPGHIEKEGASMPFDIDTLPDDAKAYVSDLEAKLAEYGEPPAALPDDLPEPVAKRLDDMSAQIAKAEAEAERISKENARLVDEAATVKYTEMATDVKDIMGDPEEVAPVFKALGTADSASFDVLYAKIANIKTIAGFDTLLKEIGSSDTGGSARDQIDAHAAEIRKNQPDLTPAEARAQAWREHPELKTQSREEA